MAKPEPFDLLGNPIFCRLPKGGVEFNAKVTAESLTLAALEAAMQDFGSCERCGKCCQKTPYLTIADVQWLLENGYGKWIEPGPRCDDRTGRPYLRLKSAGGLCVFYASKEASCIIHDHKPLACRVQMCIPNLQNADLFQHVCDRLLRDNFAT